MKQKNAQLDALVDSKKEYLEHLFDLLTEPMVATFQDIYQQCLMAPETRKKGILACFQDALVAIASWNQHLIHEYYDKVVAHTGCKYIPDLIRALISVQVKINLIANAREQSLQNIKLKVPSADNFVHRCYVDIARAVWKRPYLLYHNVRAVEKQQNLLDLEKIIQHAIRTVIRGCVPMEQLIAQIQLDAQHAETESDTSETETETESESDSESETESDTETESESESETEEPEDDEYVTVIHEADPTVDEHKTESSQSESEAEADHYIEVNTELDSENVATFERELDAEPEPEPESENVATSELDAEPELENVATSEPPEFETEEVLKKNVEVKEEVDSEDDPSSLLLAKVNDANGNDKSPMIIPSVEPVELRREVVERTTPFNMMLMNRKIVRPPSVIMKKKKKQDAFF